MSQTITNVAVDPSGQWQTVTYSDGSTSREPAPGSATATTMTNRQTLLDRATQALTTNATFLALASPTTAQNTAQIKALTRQINGIIRLLAVNDTSTITDS